MNTEVFPVYEVLVNTVFGSIGMAIMALSVVLLILLFYGRASMIFILFYMSFFFIVMGTMYFGALVLVIAFIIGGMYFALNLMKLLVRE